MTIFMVPNHCLIALECDQPNWPNLGCYIIFMITKSFSISSDEGTVNTDTPIAPEAIMRILNRIMLLFLGICCESHSQEAYKHSNLE